MYKNRIQVLGKLPHYTAVSKFIDWLSFCVAFIDGSHRQTGIIIKQLKAKSGHNTANKRMSKHW